MDHEQVRELIRRELEGVWHKRNPIAYRETSHPHRVTHETNVGDLVGHDKHAEIAQLIHSAFSDYHFRIDHLIVEGDMAAARITFYGKHTGEFLGIPATGREIKVIEQSLFRIEGDKIAEKWDLWDSLGLLQQLGVVSYKLAAP